MMIEAPKDIMTDEYEDVFVVSDLHLGGVSVKLFGQGKEFQDWVTTVVMPKVKSGRRVAIVINGDFIDFLAEPGATYFNPDAALIGLNRIASDEAFKPVFDALRAFVSQQQATLVITLGNHDLELAVPFVGTRLKQLLAMNSNDAAARIKLHLDRQGYLCRVEDKLAWCVHGNGTDPWNDIDWDEFNIRRKTWKGADAEVQWVPNAGTKLVIDVMNDLKPKYKYIDFLKPEGGAVVPVLLAVEPELYKKLPGFLASLSRLGLDSVRDFSLLSEHDRRHLLRQKRKSDRRLGQQRLLQLLEGTTDGSSFLTSGSMDSTAKLLRNAHARAIRKGMDSSPGVIPQRGRSSGHQRGRQSSEKDLLGFWDAVSAVFRRKPRPEVVRQYLLDLKKYGGFRLDLSDEMHKQYSKEVPVYIDYVVTGHTHQARSDLRMDRTVGQRYFNTGTRISRGLKKPTRISPILMHWPTSAKCLICLSHD